MSVAPSSPRAAVVPTDVIWRLTVEQYHEMVRTGILTDDDPVELLQGLLVTKMPKNPPHRITTGLLREALRPLLPNGWYVDSQEPITTEDSEPEPDVCVIRGDTRQYADRHPGPSDVALVIEVADTTLERDLTSKKQVYARAGIPVYWVIDLVGRRIEVFTDPSNAGALLDYRRHTRYADSDEVPVDVGGHVIGRLHLRTVLP
jgi:Uma2 family endonuclease